MSFDGRIEALLVERDARIAELEGHMAEILNLRATRSRQMENTIRLESRIAELEAERDEARATNRGWKDAFDKMEAERDEERAMRRFVEGRRRELEAERDEAREELKRLHRDLDAGPLTGPLALAGLRRSNAALRAEVARLREALEPFAHFPSGGRHINPDQPIEVTTTSRDIDRARVVLAEAEKKTQ